MLGVMCHLQIKKVGRTGARGVAGERGGQVHAEGASHYQNALALPAVTK